MTLITRKPVRLDGGIFAPFALARRVKPGQCCSCGLDGIVVCDARAAATPRRAALEAAAR